MIIHSLQNNNNTYFDNDILNQQIKKFKYLNNDNR